MYAFRGVGMLRFQKYKNYALIFFAMIVSAFFFQNCSPLNSTSVISAASETPNPDGPPGTNNSEDLPTSGFFVSPQGTPQGNGSIDSPWDLQTALDHPTTLKPGDTVWIRAGTYLGPFVSHLNSTSAAPIKVRAYPGERVTIDGARTETLTGSLSTATAYSTGVCSISNPRGFTEGDVILIDLEQLELLNQNQQGAFYCIRGWNGTTPAIHAQGASVKKLGDTIKSNGNYIWWWGLELTVSRPERIVNNGAYLRGGGLGLVGQGNKAINMIIHNTGHPGIGFWRQGDQGEIYGSLVWGNGIYDSDGGWTRGAGTYAQNQDGQVNISDSIWFRNFTQGIDGFGTAAAVNNFTVDGNISFDNDSHDIFFGTEEIQIQNLKLLGNYIYRKPGDGIWAVRLGYQSPAQDVLIENNYLVSRGNPALSISGFQQATVKNNTFYSQERVINFENSSYGGYSSNQNNIFKGRFGLGGIGVFNFTDWRARGFDLNSSYQSSAPNQNFVAVKPNRYEKGRANIVVYNWQNLQSVVVDLGTTGLKEGQRYQVRDAQNFFGPVVASGVYRSAGADRSVSLPMNLTEVSAIPGMTHHSNTHTPVEFNVFVVIPVF